MISSKELSLRQTKRVIGTLERVEQTVEEFLKAGGKIKTCRESNRGFWYKMKYGLQFRESEFK